MTPKSCIICKGDRQLIKITTEYGTEFFFRGGMLNAKYPRSELVPCYKCRPQEYKAWPGF